MPSPMWLTLPLLLALAPSLSVGRPSEQQQQQQQQQTKSQPLLKTLGQEIGSPSELAWQAWLLVESKGGISSALDSSNILRRITPKSIFIAPELISCPSGYSTDGKGSCKPDPIIIDEVAQKQFFLKRLNAIYGKFGANKKKPEPPQGPLQINIPIASQPSTNVSQLEAIPLPVVADQPVDVAANNKSQEAVAVMVYKVANETKKDDDESSGSFLLGNANSSAPKKVAEIVVDTNGTFAGVLDYKIPVQANSTDLAQPSNKTVKEESSSEDSSPAVVLLLAPTKLPFITDKPEEAHRQQQEISTEEAAKMTETTTLPTTTITTIDETSFETIQTVAPLDLETEVDATVTTTERTFSTRSRDDDYGHRDQQMSTTTLAPSTLNDETAYTDEDETEKTQTPEQESADEQEEENEEEYEDEFAEDELLKPGEAGTLMSPKNQELIRSKAHASTTVPVTSTTTAAATTTTTTTTMLQDTTTIPPTVDDMYDANESTIKVEVTGFTAQTTDLPSTIVNTVPIVVVVEEATTPPAQRAVKATIQINPEEEKPPQAATTIRATTDNPSEAPSTFFPQRKPAASLTVNDEPIFLKDADGRRDHLPAEFKDQLSRERSYVRFPESAQQQQQQQQQRSFVRFPSDDVNSIHGGQDSLKDLSPFQYSSSTKSSVQRWRQQKQKPMLLKFWARMPLVRDLTFYPTTSHGSHNEPIGGSTTPSASRRGLTFGSDG